MIHCRVWCRWGHNWWFFGQLPYANENYIINSFIRLWIMILQKTWCVQHPMRYCNPTSILLADRLTVTPLNKAVSASTRIPSCTMPHMPWIITTNSGKVAGSCDFQNSAMIVTSKAAIQVILSSFTFKRKFWIWLLKFVCVPLCRLWFCLPFCFHQKY